MALTSASSVSWDAQAAANAFLLLGHNATFAAPSNDVDGAIISVEIAQPRSDGPNTLAGNTVY